jgi:NAD+ dependent glucose-6-phosphate dehydrogenase
VNQTTVLITGAGGLIGSHLRVALAGKYHLRLVSSHPIPGVETTVADITDMTTMLAAFKGVDSIIHLAASVSVSSPWDAVLRNNIIGTYTIFEAAQQAGVQQVIYASSNHAVGTYETEYAQDIRNSNQVMIDHLVPIRPDSLYGVSKCFGEALGRYYADHRGLRVICLRIGWINRDDVARGNPIEYGMWQSKRDFTQLVEKCLAADRVKFDIFYGVSNNPNRYFDIEHAKEVVGYVPQDG